MDSVLSPALRKVYVHPPSEQEEKEETLRAKIGYLEVPDSIRDIPPFFEWLKTTHGVSDVLAADGWKQIPAKLPALALPDTFSYHFRKTAGPAAPSASDGLDFKGRDVIHEIQEYIREQQIMLPALEELASFIVQTPQEHLRFPVPIDVYDRLRGSSICERVFRVAKHGDNWLRPVQLVKYTLDPPTTDTSEDSFHFFWDSLIFEPISWFLGGVIKNTRNEAGESTFGTTRCDVTYYLNGYALLKGEEKGILTAGDPSYELVNKGSWPYFDSLPYVLGYWAIGHRVTLCALYRDQMDRETVRRDLIQLDLRLLDHRICMLVACLQFSRILFVLEQICTRQGVEPDVTYPERNGKTVKLIGNKVVKIYGNDDRARYVMSIYTTIQGCPNVEQMLHARAERSCITMVRGIRKHPVNERELVNCVICILQALVCIHSHGIMHRDVRWENIVKSWTKNSWMLIDFDEATKSPCSKEHLLAKENHAPEIFGPHDYKVDIWGVGFLLQKSGVLLADELRGFGQKCSSVDPGARPNAEFCLKYMQNYERMQGWVP